MKSVGGKGVRTGQFDFPRGIALSQDNKLFVCDSYNHRIQVFDTKLKFVFCFDEAESGVIALWHFTASPPPPPLGMGVWYQDYSAH